MKTSLIAAAVLPLLATATTTPSVTCQTLLGGRPVAHVPTATGTVTNSQQPSVRIPVRSTVTTFKGYWYTYTHFTTSTSTITAVASTDVITTTSTIIDTETDTETDTITNTFTSTMSTSSTSTSTVPTAAGFSAIGDTLNSNHFARRGEEIQLPHQARSAAAPVRGVLAAQYPTAVTCTKTVPNTHTRTAYTTLAPTTVTEPYYAYWTTTWITLTTETTLIPPEVTSTDVVSTTTTVTTTTTSMTTTTNTVSTTTTSIIPGPTVYSACSNANVFGSDFTHSGKAYYAANVDNNGPYVTSNFQVVADGASNPIDCCTACFAYGACETFIFRLQNRNCFLLTHTGETCLQSNHPNFILSSGGNDTGAGYQVGNGPCGYTYSGNSDGSVFSVDGY